MPDPARIRADAEAMAEAYKLQLGATPTVHAIVLLVAQGTIETAMGRAWPGPDAIVGTEDDENNVGACTLRSVNSVEYAAIAAAAQAALVSIGIPARGTLKFVQTNAMAWADETGAYLQLNARELDAVSPWLPIVSKGHKERAKNAEAAILAAGLPLASGIVATKTNAPIEVPAAHIHCDSLPLKGGGNRPYFTWFAAWPGAGGLVQGCRYYIYLAIQGKQARAVVENPNGTEYQFAAALRLQGYYTGFHDNSGGPGSEGWEANVKAYAGLLASATPAIRAALKDWTPGGTIGPIPEKPPEIPILDLSKPEDQFRALQLLGCVRPYPPAPAFAEKRFRASIGFYQGGSLCIDETTPIDVDGDIGMQQTLPALKRDLAKYGILFKP